MKIAKASLLASLIFCGISASASAVTIGGFSKGKTGLAFCNPFTVCGTPDYEATFKNFSYSSPALKSFNFGSHASPVWACGGFSFDCSGFTAPTSTCGTFALSGLGVGKAFKKPPTTGVEPKPLPQPEPEIDSSDPGGGSEKVPDGGSTLLMLGASLLGLHGFVKLLKPRN